MAGVGGRNPARYEQRRTSEPVRPLVFVGCRAAWRVTAGSRGGRVGARGSDPHHHPREPRIADGRGRRLARHRYRHRVVPSAARRYRSHHPAVAGDDLCDGPDRLSRQHQAAGAGARAPDRAAGSARSRAGVATARAAESLAAGAPPPALPPVPSKRRGSGRYSTVPPRHHTARASAVMADRTRNATTSCTKPTTSENHAMSASTVATVNRGYATAATARARLRIAPTRLQREDAPIAR